VIEQRAPTEESVRLMEEMHDKAMKNLIAKVKVDNNLVKGECFCFAMPYSFQGDVKLVFKFNINGKDFLIEKFVDRMSFGWEEDQEIKEFTNFSVGKLNKYAEGVMLWYVLKVFTGMMFQQITGGRFPEELLK
jgi:hypothetical protein